MKKGFFSILIALFMLVFMSGTIVFAEGDPVLVAGITITSPGDVAIIAEGETLQLTAHILPEDAADPSVTWSADSQGVATVDSNGLVTAISAGNVTISANANDGSGISGTYQLTVTIFSGGGTSEDPYKIRSVANLQRLAGLVNSANTAYSQAYYLVENDIDFSSISNWTPIGIGTNAPGDSKSFRGVLNGNGFTVRNLHMVVNTSSIFTGGLFAHVSGGTIENLGMESCSFSATTSNFLQLGAIAGYIDGNAQIRNCHSSSTIIVTSNSNGYYCSVGGVIGHSSGGNTISGCYNTGNVSASLSSNSPQSNNLNMAGGIIGATEGYANNGDSITRCYNTGYIYVRSEQRTSGLAGGIAGKGNGNIVDCYNAGRIRASVNGYSGGIAGIADNASIIRCYNAGNVMGLSRTNNGVYTGGISGSSVNGSTTHDCYYLYNSRYGVGAGGDTTISLAPGEMTSSDSFINFDFDAVWTITADQAYPYPELQGMPYAGDLPENTTDFAGGNGSSFSPFVIRTKEQFNIIRNYLGTCFILDNDLIFTTEDFAAGGDFYNNGAGFLPFGTNESPFWGSFNGNGHVISGLKQILSSSSNLYGGIFGYATDARIENLGIENCNIDITSSSKSSGISAGSIAGYIDTSRLLRLYNTGSITSVYAGGIAGSVGADCTFEKCYNTGTIVSKPNVGKNSYAGGIAGYMMGSNISSVSIITDSYNKGAISADSGNNSDDNGRSCAGGIAGFIDGAMIQKSYNTGTVTSLYYGAYGGGIAGSGLDNNGSTDISNCYNSRIIKSDGYAGGIAGYSFFSIDKCYNVGNIISSDYVGDSIVGGIVGANYDLYEGMISNCYYMDTAQKGIGYGTDTTTRVTKEQMQRQDTFGSFDFTAIWSMNGSATYPYPELISNNDTTCYAIAIVVASNQDTVERTRTLQMSATVQPSDADNKEVSWSVINGTGEATITETGLLTGTKTGLVTVIATALDGTGITGEKTVTIAMLDPHTIEYRANGATSGFVPTVDILYERGKGVVVLGNEGSLAKTGYVFSGWNTQPNGEGVLYSAGDTYIVGDADVVLFAKWLPIDYTITFNTQGGTPIAPKTAAYNATITAPTPPTLVGYTFAGWYKDKAGTTPWNFNVDTVIADTTLYATWTQNPPRSYTVSFVSLGGSSVASQIVTAGSLVTRPDNPTRNGYTFTNWITSTGDVWNFTSDVVSSNMNLYATWVQNPPPPPSNYAVSFDSRGGSDVGNQTIVHGGQVASPAAPTRASYNFTGWYKDSACTSPWIFSTDSVTGDTTLYAGWTAQTASNYLSGISLSAGTLTKGFSAKTTSYTVNLGENDAAVTITPAKAYDSAAMTIDGKSAPAKTLALANGKTATVTVKVTWNKKTITYKLTVKRAKSTANTLAALTATAGTWSQAFDPSVGSYALTLPESVSKVTLKATRASALASVTPASKAFTLKNGQTVKATFKVKAQSGATRTYTVTITRAKSTNTNLASLKTSAKGMAPGFKPVVTDYTIVLPAKTASVTITAKAADKLSAVRINGAKKATLTVKLANRQSTTVTVTVVSQAGISKNYTVMVSRQ